jgi:hypothetical protein
MVSPKLFLEPEECRILPVGLRYFSLANPVNLLSCGSSFEYLVMPEGSTSSLVHAHG